MNDREWAAWAVREARRQTHYAKTVLHPTYPEIERRELDIADYFWAMAAVATLRYLLEDPSA